MLCCGSRRFSTLIRDVREREFLPFSASKKNEEFREYITQIIKNHLTGQWQNVTPSDLLIEKISGGFSNLLFQISLPSSREIILINEPTTVLLRLHQPSYKHDSVFDIVSESLAVSYASERKLGPKIFAVFPGGRIEEYINGRSLETVELGKTKFSFAIAEKMSLVHSLDVPVSRKKGLLYDLMEKWLGQTEELSSKWKRNDGAQECIEYFKNHNLLSEVSWLRNFLSDTNSPILFCHNDIQEGNILVTNDSTSLDLPNIIFIDYEYSFYNYRGFEFANHFLEYTMNYNVKEYPHFVINMNEYPSVEHQVKFFDRYLSARRAVERLEKRNDLSSGLDDNNSGSGAEVREMVSQLLNETSKFRLASHLLWGIWAALRSDSQIRFGYWEYSRARLETYFRTKEEICSEKTDVKLHQ